MSIMPVSRDWLSRGEVAEELDVSISTIRRMEKSGALKHKIGRNQVRQFAREDVDRIPTPKQRKPKKLARKSAGDLAAEAFKMFALGHSLRDCVIALRADPEDLQRLYGHFHRNNIRERVDKAEAAALDDIASQWREAPGRQRGVRT